MLTGARILELLAQELRTASCGSAADPVDEWPTWDQLIEAVNCASQRAADEQWENDMGDDL